jgi:hypothetical protein
MSEKISWMLGMTDNMINISKNNSEEMFRKAFDMKSNLYQMRLLKVNQNKIDALEPVMRNLEVAMVNLDWNNNQHKNSVHTMMDYVLSIQKLNK